MNHDELLAKIATQGLNLSSSDDLSKLACAYWHENYTPNLQVLSKKENINMKLVGYLTEFFSNFNVISDIRYEALKSIVSNIRKTTEALETTPSADDIASSWGLHENINPFLATILKFQTRHYMREPKG